MKRVVSVWLPDWPIARRARRLRATSRPDAGSPEGSVAADLLAGPPFALVEKGPRGLTVQAANAAARALGIARGGRHADARALCPELETLPADPDGDARGLKTLALYAERWAPAVSVDQTLPGFEGLVLDVTGATHLFGGEMALLDEIEARLGAAGVPARAALADTVGAAWALARFSEARTAPVGGAREALADLPCEALRLEAAATAGLKRFGLRRIGDLYALPRAGLARRFRGESAGLEVVRRLDQALGAEPEALIPVRPAPRYRVGRRYAEPLGAVEGLEAQLPDLARALCEALERDGQGARRARLIAFRVDGAAPELEVKLSRAARAPARLIRLIRELGLERIEIGFGIDALMLVADETEALSAVQAGLDGEASARPPEEAAAELIDRLAARLGEGAALAPVARESWIPERSEALVPADAEGGAVPRPARARPILLFEPPERVEAIAELPDHAPARFTWRRVARRVTRARGPERLSPEWWRPLPADARRPRTRDYFVVEDEAGRRYWLFREGLYGREDGDRRPEWFVHGVFP